MGKVKSPNNWFYSWDIGLVHFVAISTEIYFDYLDMIPVQWNWLKQDLEKANANRDNVPWIVVHGHRSMYCSCDGDCDGASDTVRDGPGTPGVYGLEELMQEYGVEIFINGHEHNYERMWDIYN